jgi:hypothetical protein
LTAHQQEFLDQDTNTAATAQDFQILNLRLEQLGSQQGVAPESVRMHVAEIPNSVQPRRAPSRKLGYAFATVLAVAIVAGPFVSILSSRSSQKHSGPSIWDNTLKGKVIRAYLISDQSGYVVRFNIAKDRATIEKITAIEQFLKKKGPPALRGSKVDKAKTEQANAFVEGIPLENKKFFDRSGPLETSSSLLPFVTLEGCKKAYGTGARVTSELRSEANYTWTEWTFEKDRDNRLVRIAHMAGEKLIQTNNYMARKNAESP